MPDPRIFMIAREIARREVERHPTQFIGVTVNTPRHEDVNGVLEWVVDVRIGRYDDSDDAGEHWEVIRDCAIAQWALGIVTDMDVPVRCERGENGRVVVVGRSNIYLPDIQLDTYSYADLGRTFMSTAELQSDGSYEDGFGYTVVAPSSETGSTTRRRRVARLIEWGSTDFDYGTTEIGEVSHEWEDY